MTMTLSSANAERLKQAFQQCRDMEGTLREQLEAYAAAGREIFPAYGEAVDRLVARVNENGGGENAPRPGEVMPPFLLPDETGRLISIWRVSRAMTSGCCRSRRPSWSAAMDW